MPHGKSAGIHRETMMCDLVLDRKPLSLEMPKFDALLLAIPMPAVASLPTAVSAVHPEVGIEPLLSA